MRTLLTLSGFAMMSTLIGGCVHDHHDHRPPPCPPPRTVVYRPAPVVVHRDHYYDGYQRPHARPDFGRADSCDW